MRSLYQRDNCCPFYIKALDTIAQIRKCPSIEELAKCAVYIFNSMSFSYEKGRNPANCDIDGLQGRLWRVNINVFSSQI